ncbi:MAG: metallophosphoesterase [Deltaproteobacteria bacterium]|nr:metallophosphoesterase [Deltaproteobacteria bacterium]
MSTQKPRRKASGNASDEPRGRWRRASVAREPELDTSKPRHGPKSARERLRRTHHDVPLPIARCRRVAHLTDLHVGWSSTDELLLEAVAAVRDAEPDLVVLTGDYLNHSLSHLSRLGAIVRELPGPRVAVLGNHDHWSGASSIQAELERAGVIVLRNESVTVDGLLIVGVDDGRTRRSDVGRAFRGVAAPESALVLTHFPPTAVSVRDSGGRIVLCGHTHAGHVGMPRLVAAAGKLSGNRWIHGWYDLDPTRLYVNAGLGHDRLRFGRSVTPEVAVFELLPSG